MANALMKLVDKLPQGAVAKIGVGIAKEAFNNIKDCYLQAKQIEVNAENTRCQILAARDARIAEIRRDTEVVINYFKEAYKERSKNFSKLFDNLDYCIKTNNIEGMQGVLATIVKYGEQSPLAEADRMIQALENHSDECFKLC